MLFTIGYEKSDLSDFIGTLQKAQVEILIDIRDRAQSRRKGFSKSILSETLRDFGIDYLHLRSLGDPKPGREAARAGDMDGFRKIYYEILDSDAARQAMVQLQEIASHRRTCLMCYEVRAMDCHRAIVASRLTQEGGPKPQHLGVKKIGPRRPLRDHC